MPTLLVSSKGQIVLPVAIRRRLGLNTGARLEVFEEADGIKLRVLKAVPTVDLTDLAGMVQAPSRGKPRRLEDFDPASDLADALHVARSARAASFVTFDRKLATRAERMKEALRVPVELLHASPRSKG